MPIHYDKNLTDLVFSFLVTTYNFFFLLFCFLSAGFIVKNFYFIISWLHLNNYTPYENKCFKPRNQNHRVAFITRIRYATTQRICWTRYPSQSSNGWSEFWAEPMKFLVDMLNHSHWLRIHCRWWWIACSAIMRGSCMFNVCGHRVSRDTFVRKRNLLTWRTPLDGFGFLDWNISHLSHQPCESVRVIIHHLLGLTNPNTIKSYTISQKLSPNKQHEVLHNRPTPYIGTERLVCLNSPCGSCSWGPWFSTRYVPGSSPGPRGHAARAFFSTLPSFLLREIVFSHLPTNPVKVLGLTKS